MARGMIPISDGFSLVTVKHHEGSTVFSFEGESDKPFEQLQNIITGLIDQLQQEIDRQDGIVGHIKAFAQDDGASCAFSATGGDIHTKHGKLRCTKISFAAIVFIAEEDPIVELMEEVLSQI